MLRSIISIAALRLISHFLIHISLSYIHRSTPYHIASAQFEKQPPDNMRKSNFFHFIISLFDGQQHRIQVQKAVFKDFYDTIGTVSEAERERESACTNACMHTYSDMSNIVHDSLWSTVFLLK